MKTRPAATMLLYIGPLIVAGCAERRVGQSMCAERFHKVLDAQADAWNRGDIDGFMRPYWQSERLTFSSEGHTRRGWAETKTRFEKRYPTPERMGRLRFSDLEVHVLGERAALVLGRWHLTREPDSVGGNFSLVFELIDGEWKIIHDHTSVASGAKARPSSRPEFQHRGRRGMGGAHLDNLPRPAGTAASRPNPSARRRWCR
jgi:ketosteroid isomerase-like protein